MKPSQSILLRAATAGIIYALLDLLSVYPSLLIPFKLEAIWLPSGFLFAMLMRSPRRHWPALLGAAALAGFFVNLGQGWSPLPAFAFCATNPLEVILGAWVAHLLLKGRDMDLSRIPDALILGLAGLLNGLVIGPSALLAAGAAGVPLTAPYIGAVWSGSVLLSHLFIAPLILAWPGRGSRRNRILAESLIWMAAGAAITRWGLHGGAGDGVAGLLMFLPFPLLVGAALRTGPFGVCLSMAAVSFTALVEAAHGHSPLPMQGMGQNLMMVWIQLFLATQAVSLLILACAAEAQRNAEGSLLESESRYRSLVEQFPDAIILREGAFIRYANPAAVALFGASSPSDLEGRPIREFLQRPEPSSDDQSLSGTHRYRPSLRDRMLKSLDHREIPVEVTDIRIALAGRRPLTLDVFRDLSMRRAAEAALRRSEQDFQRFFDLAPIPLALSTARDGRILRSNAHAKALFELEDGEAEELRTSDFYARQEERDRILSELRAKGRLDGAEIDMLTRKGRLRRVITSAALVTYQGEEAVLTGFMDLTLRLKTEEALRQAQKLESLGLMAGGIAHDFNNLLTALIGNLDLARMSHPDPGASSPFLDAMSATLRRASDLARQMLAYAGQARVEIRPVDLNASARELAGLMSASMSKKIELRFELAEDLPLVEGDPVQLQQVLLNLITNAADAVGDREGVITVSSRVDGCGPEGEPGGRSAVLEVRDTGAGMSAQVKARIFDPFFTTKASGRGLGLSALLGILKAHKAAVQVESEPGSGTRFILRFPLPEKAVEQDPRVATGAFFVQAVGGRVLLVDDEAEIRTTAGAQLQRMGFQVIEAADGREALSEVDRHGDALIFVILDLSMPRMDGAEALARIRERHPDLRVILSSGFDPKQRTPELLQQPNTWFLPKPYRLSELRKMVSEVLGSSPAR